MTISLLHPTSKNSVKAKFVEDRRLLKNSLSTRFHPTSGTKHTDFWAFRARSLVIIHLKADFFNRLTSFYSDT